MEYESYLVPSGMSAADRNAYLGLISDCCGGDSSGTGPLEDFLKDAGLFTADHVRRIVCAYPCSLAARAMSARAWSEGGVPMRGQLVESGVRVFGGGDDVTDFDRRVVATMSGLAYGCFYELSDQFRNIKVTAGYVDGLTSGSGAWEDFGAAVVSRVPLRCLTLVPGFSAGDRRRVLGGSRFLVVRPWVAETLVHSGWQRGVEEDTAAALSWARAEAGLPALGVYGGRLR